MVGRLQTYNNFNDNSKVWIIGIPSGEAFQISRDQLDDLYVEALIMFTTKYISTGFYAFNDSEKYKILRMLAWTEKKDNKEVGDIEEDVEVDNNPSDFIIYENDYGDDIVLEIVNIIKRFQLDIEMVVEDTNIKISLDNYCIESNMKLEGYEIKIFKKGKEIDRYSVPVKKYLIERINFELIKIYKGL